MMQTITVTVDSAAARAAFARAPEAMLRFLREGVMKAGELVARETRKAASASDRSGVLRNSIASRALEDLPDGQVGAEVRPATRYALFVEEGTGPAAGRPRYYPNPDSLLDYLRTTPSSRSFKWARKGSAKRGGQDLELWLRSRAWAMAIYARGTRAHPFMVPGAQAAAPAVQETMADFVRRGVAEAFGNG